MKGQQAVMRELREAHTEPVRDPVWRHIHLSPALMRLVDTPEFQQLNRIRQLGPTYLVYPGATHTRFSHSLGVVHVARQLLLHLCRREDAPTLSPEGVRAFLAAALLHDVGHFPYTHSFKTLPLAEHEELTGQIVRSGVLARRIRDDLGVSPGIVAAIVDQKLPCEDNREVQLYRRILSGSLDPDKLDYLNRDAYFCGVPYGTQDLDFALSRIVPAGYRGIALDAQGISAVENILFSKYLMYRAVYWHRTVRVATAMMRKAVYLALRENVLRPEDLYSLDDELLLARFRAIQETKFPPVALLRRAAARNLLKPVADIAFSPADPDHRALEDNTHRERLEERIARELRSRGAPRAWEVIIDLPDRVSFEAEFPIREEERLLDFSEVSVFSRDVVERFTTTLRRIRLILPEEAAEDLREPEAFLREMIS